MLKQTDQYTWVRSITHFAVPPPGIACTPAALWTRAQAQDSPSNERERIVMNFRYREVRSIHTFMTRRNPYELPPLHDPGTPVTRELHIPPGFDMQSLGVWAVTDEKHQPPNRQVPLLWAAAGHPVFGSGFSFYRKLVPQDLCALRIPLAALPLFKSSIVSESRSFTRHTEFVAADGLPISCENDCVPDISNRVECNRLVIERHHGLGLLGEEVPTMLNIVGLQDEQRTVLRHLTMQRNASELARAWDRDDHALALEHVLLAAVTPASAKVIP